MKFRRQHPIEPWIVDCACPEQRLVVEIDGGYHDYVVESDLKRQEHLEAMDWKVLRFGDKDVEEDVEAIAKELHLEYEFSLRKATGSGMQSINAVKKK